MVHHEELRRIWDGGIVNELWIREQDLYELGQVRAGRDTGAGANAYFGSPAREMVAPWSLYFFLSWFFCP